MASKKVVTLLAVAVMEVAALALVGTDASAWGDEDVRTCGECRCSGGSPCLEKGFLNGEWHVNFDGSSCEEVDAACQYWVEHGDT